jgi:RES domain-containing protein
MTLPPVTLVRRLDTHRLVPSRHLPGEASVLADLAADDAELQAIGELEAATNDRLLAHRQRLAGIGVEELVFGVPHADVVNAAFCHAHPLGARFSGPERGAWYAAFELDTAQAEVGFHRSVQLAEVARFDDSVTYDDYLSDLSASLHDLRDAPLFRSSLDPRSYVHSQALAEALLAAGSLGVVYPSVRWRGGTCVAAFRPALVVNVRRDRTYRFTWDGTSEPAVHVESASPA